MATVCHFFLLHFFTIILLVQARLNLETADHDALLAIYKDLGVSTGSNNICNAAGIFCALRISNGTNVLRVTRVVFKQRQLRGIISPAIGKLSELKELSLPNNYIVNQIPSQITNCRKLEVLNLQSNRFSGKVPSGLSSLVRLRVLDLSSNKFSGDLDFLKYFTNLEKLSLANNMFTGKVPASLRYFRNLRFFNISGNSFLEGTLPTMNKRFIFAESNSTKQEVSISDNLQIQAPSPTSEPIYKHKNKAERVIRLSLGFSFGALTIIICGMIYSVAVMNLINGKSPKRNYDLWSTKKSSRPMIFTQLIKAKDLKFLENDEEVASLGIIGRGGCGKVYKTELQESITKTITIKKGLRRPKEIAIKKVLRHPKDVADEDSGLPQERTIQIKSEIQTAGLIRHRNLLPLLAIVSRPNCHYLVYEFMKNGSLQDIMQQLKDGSRELDWLARHRIALGVAEGLEYLHTSITPRIVHGDLKPANVLLDNDMNPHITDFGLAESIPDFKTHIQTFHVGGTLGYIAPEYFETMELTEKCDIYSFGVLLAVLVMGKLPSDEFFRNTYEMGLVEWMRNVMDPDEAIDPKLIGNRFEEQMIRVLDIAHLCTLPDPRERPNSKDCRVMLAQIHHYNSKFVNQ